MQGNDRGLNQSPQKYETSFQQLMAQRYPQTNRSIAPAPFPQAPDLPTPGQSANQQQQMAHSLHGQQSHVQQLTSQQYRPNMTQQRQQSSPNASNGFAQGSPTGSIQRPKGMPSFQNASLSSINKHQAQARPSTASGLSKQTNTSKSSKKDSSSKQSGQTSGLVFNTPQQKDHLVNCDWKDKILWASRLILGGNSINGFLRATATAQRIKKQRARQIALTKKTAAAASGEKEDKVKDNSKKAFDQAEEEKLKKDIMNPRTAKKIKSELEAGLQFCAAMHNVLRKALFEIDPAQTPYLPPNIFLEDDKPAVPSVLIPSIPKQGASYQQTLPNASVLADMPWAVKSNAAGGPQASYTKKGIQSQPGNSMFNHSLNMTKNQPPGNPDGSTLRKLRKKKLPPSNEPSVFIPEFDGSGKRIYTKKEHNYRLFELLRFRPLRQGDFVAARLSSRDLWILARVLKDYPGANMAPLEFLNLTGARRDAVFRDRVLLKDVEEKDEESSVQVLRSLALPLPRTHSEAAEWGQRIKKGSRVYAMYPQTTSLYAATVIDSTTYCREDDDIIVVEFDGEEYDHTGQVPTYHIPARFVTLIPREFPASQATPTGNKNKRKGAPQPAAPSAKRERRAEDDFLLMDFGDGLGNFDALDLDFDKPLEENEDAFAPIL